MASRMAGVGRVSVSERRSTTSCMGLPRGGPEALGRAATPLGIRVLVGDAPERLLGICGPPIRRVDLGQAEQGLRDDQRAGVVLDGLFEALPGGDGIALVQV